MGHGIGVVILTLQVLGLGNLVEGGSQVGLVLCIVAGGVGWQFDEGEQFGEVN
jgi:hypothetical protein